MVGELDDRRHDAERASHTLSTVASLMRGMHRPDAREHVCKAARDISDAAFAMIMELDGDELATTAQAGSKAPPQRLRVSGEPSGAVVAFTTRERFFVARAAGHPAVSPRLTELLGVVSVVFEPILMDDRCVGLLVVAWRHEVETIDTREGVALGLIGIEAASSCSRPTSSPSWRASRGPTS